MEWIRYDELTWPEVAALPRTTRLVLPLGEGYDWEALAQDLGNTGAPAALLPAIPFGWQGSGLSLPPAGLEAYVTNLAQSLQADGFQDVYLATCDERLFRDLPRVLRLPAGKPPLEDLTAQRGKVILLPIGHTEQHAYHLPLSTDTLIIEAISQETAAAIPARAYSLPVMPYGVSMHRTSFAGTMNAGGRAFEDFWLAVIDALAAQGFKLFYLLSGHGGNMSFLVNVVKYAGERHPRIFCATSFLYLSGPQGIAALEQHRRSPIGGMGHACELETSLILHLRPDLARMERVVDETDFISTPSYYMDWIEGGALIANPPWTDDTQSGAYGAGSLATREHGKLWLEAAVAEKIAHVGEIEEQQRRREARRSLKP